MWTHRLQLRTLTQSPKFGRTDLDEIKRGRCSRTGPFVFLTSATTQDLGAKPASRRSSVYCPLMTSIALSTRSCVVSLFRGIA